MQQLDYTPEPTTVVVTGGAGFIGSNFVHYMLRTYGDSVRIVVLDALTYAGHLESLEGALGRENVVFEQADISDAPAVRRILASHRPQYVVNFAAESHVDRSITDPGVFVRTNVQGTHTMLEETRRLWQDGGCQGRCFLQVGTDEVYGSLPIEWPEGRKEPSGITVYGSEFFTEETPLAPRSPYSASKAAADFMALAYAHTYGMPVVVTRCSNNYGPRQFPEKLIPLMISNLLEGKKIPVYGDGMNVRDWLFVDDHCRAIDMAMRQGLPGQVYNIGGHNESSNIRLVRTVIGEMRRFLEAHPEVLPALDRSSIDESAITYVADRLGHDRRYAIDPSKAAACLGWAPTTRFEEGIARTIEWYLANTEWIKNVLNKSAQS